MTDQQREQKRFGLGRPATLSYRHGPKSSPSIPSVLANISSGGAFVQTEHDFPLAAKVSLAFSAQLTELQELGFLLSVQKLREFAGEQIHLQLTGVVIRREKNGVAIIFDTDYQFTPL